MLEAESSSTVLTRGEYAIDIHAPGYLQVLDWLHIHLKPKTYLEVGTLHGDTLRISQAKSIAVDPRFDLKVDVIGAKGTCALFQMTSDAFFSEYDPEVLLGGKIELAFLDGLHWHEVLLRDFANTERHCRRNSVIAIHDCIPSDEYMARRNIDDYRSQQLSIEPNWWTGDVWKAVAILQKCRPELVIYPISTPPSGLILITNLDPLSDLIAKNYFELISELGQDMDLRSYLATLKLIDANSFCSSAGVSEYLWL